MVTQNMKILAEAAHIRPMQKKKMCPKEKKELQMKMVNCYTSPKLVWPVDLACCCACVCPVNKTSH